MRSDPVPSVPRVPRHDGGVKHCARTHWSTADVGGADASSYWSDAVCDAFVGVAVRPRPGGQFRARLEYGALDGIGFATVSAGAQQVARTDRLIARDDEDFVLANIQLRGRARLEQDGRLAALAPGAMAFVDSTRPYTLDFASDFSQLVVKVPTARLSRRKLAAATAVELDAAGPGRLVADFMVSLDRLQAGDPAAAASLVPHAVDLLGAALAWAEGRGLPQGPATGVVSECVRQFVRRHALDPLLDAAAVAAGCGVSRRTMFRALAADGEQLTAMIRRARISRAQQLVLADPARTLAAVARECGFGGEAQLHRAFRAVTGMTPGAYRSQRPDGP